MPLVVPPFSQFQGSLFPLRGLWNTPPREGDYFVNAEIDWTSYQPNDAVQFALSGNSPVALSQIVALYVDNRRCGVDCDFQFPDSGFLLTVPAHAQGLFPVLTNALMFYAIASGAAASDVTIVQILNSLPPPIPLVPSAVQNQAGVTGVALQNSTTQVVPATTSGTVNGISGSVDLTAAGSAGVTLQDGTGQVIWAAVYNSTAPPPQNIPVNLSGLGVRFRNGLQLVVNGAATSIGLIDLNVYYSSP